MALHKHVFELLVGKGLLLLSIAFAVSAFVLVRLLRSDIDVLQSEIDRRAQQQDDLLREQSLYTEYAPQFDAMVVGGNNPAVTRLGWQASVHEIAQQLDGKVGLLVLDAQRNLTGDMTGAIAGYQLNETVAEVEVEIPSEPAVLSLVKALSRLSRYGTDVRSCSVSLNLVDVSLVNLPQLSPLVLACKMHLYEVSKG